MRLLPLAAAIAVTALVVPVTLALRDGGAPEEPDPAAPQQQQWTGTATLLQTPGGDLTLCGGMILTSLPPAGCGGAAVRGLDPMTVAGAERYPNGTITTPSVRLVGTWDGSALTVTQPYELAEPTGPPPPADIPGPTCPEPEGGWPFDRVDRVGWDLVHQYASTQPDAGTPRVDPSQRILTVPFTGDLDRHRAEITELYDGPVCVEPVERSSREMHALFEQVKADLGERGLQMLHGSPGAGQGYVEVFLVAVTPEEKTELEKQYDGLLRVDSFLQPL